MEGGDDELIFPRMRTVLYINNIDIVSYGLTRPPCNVHGALHFADTEVCHECLFWFVVLETTIGTSYA